MQDRRQLLNAWTWRLMEITRRAFGLVLYDSGQMWITKGDGYDPPVFYPFIPLNQAALLEWKEKQDKSQSSAMDNELILKVSLSPMFLLECEVIGDQLEHALESGLLNEDEAARLVCDFLQENLDRNIEIEGKA